MEGEETQLSLFNFRLKNRGRKKSSFKAQIGLLDRQCDRRYHNNKNNNTGNFGK